jgi:hypothetical protein
MDVNNNNMWNYEPNLQGQGEWNLTYDGHVAATVYRDENFVQTMVDNLNDGILNEGPATWEDELYNEKYR